MLSPNITHLIGAGNEAVSLSVTSTRMAPVSSVTSTRMAPVSSEGSGNKTETKLKMVF